MHLLKVLFIIFEVVLLFNVLIFVHELGHFLAARWRGLKVERFAIWFGKPIWKKKIGDVEYALGSIPAGGYVSLPQMASMDVIEGKAETPADRLPPISSLDKIIVAFAGPLFSFGLALVFAFIVSVVGKPESESETTTVIGYVAKDGPADQAGLRPGDRILEVDGHKVTRFSGLGASVMWRIVRSEGESVDVKVERDGKVLEFLPKPKKEVTGRLQRSGLRKIQIGPAQTPIVAEVMTNSPAAVAGLKPGDVIDSLNGEKIYSFGSVDDFVETHGVAPMRLAGVHKSGGAFDVNLTPEIPVSPRPEVSSEGSHAEGASSGIIWDPGKMALVYPSAIEQVQISLGNMFSMFGALFSRKSDIKFQHLGGAVKILSVYYYLFEHPEGWRLALWFSVLMNVNLALLNMLPFPVLDGGHITLAIIESFRGRPVSAKLLNYVQTGCAVVLIVYMVYIAFFDVQDIYSGRSQKKEPEIKFHQK